jgi:DNA-binding beta-propeller fold protein YncE
MLAFLACAPTSTEETETPEEAPISFEAVASEGAPLDATPNSDASEIWFVGMPEGTPTLFKVSNGAASPVVAGSPLVAPENLSISPDDSRIYVADPGADAIFVFDSAGTLVETLAEGLSPRGVDATEEGLVFVGAAGLYMDGQEVTGAPFKNPSAVVRVADGTIYVTDSPGEAGAGKVIKVTGGEASVFVDGLTLGDPAGISSTLDGATLVVSAINPDTGNDAVLLVTTSSGEYLSTSAGIEGNVEGGGVHRAAAVNVWVWADLSAGGSGRVYRVE